jgi:epsilon-lactone hydrolase
MWLTKPLFNYLSIKTSRALQELFGDIKAKGYVSGLNFKPVSINGCKACFIEHENQKPGKVILYLHGGAYVYGNIEYARGIASIFAYETNQNVFCIAYRLAPENPFPAAVEDALAAYEYLLDKGYDNGSISLVGESAGGGLVFSLCLKLKQKGLPLPSAIVCLSPWTDLTFSGASYKLCGKKDPVLSEKGLRKCAALYAAGHETDPLVSPLCGDLTGFPPSLIFAGSCEVLLDDAKSMAQKLIDSGNSCELVIEEGLWHVYVLFNIPEAKKALRKIAGFLE